MPFTRSQIQDAVAHLSRVDATLGGLIAQAGPFTLRPDRDRFGMLVRSIVSQQISTAAARTIRLRLLERLEPHPLSAAAIQSVTDEELRLAGLSAQKISYLRDLSARVLDERLRLDRIGRLGDEGVIEHLTQVRGIGRWTAQMFLIFSLGRLDVFPHDDLGVRSSLRTLYQLETLPDQQTSEQISAPWAPYRSVAAWYCWRLADVRAARRIDAREYPV